MSTQMKRFGNIAVFTFIYISIQCTIEIIKIGKKGYNKIKNYKKEFYHIFLNFNILLLFVLLKKGKNKKLFSIIYYFSFINYI